MDINRTIVVKALDVLEARQIADQFVGGTGMFTVPKTEASDGVGPVSHYLASGWLAEDIVAQFEAYNTAYGTTKYDITDLAVESVAAVCSRLGIYNIYQEA